MAETVLKIEGMSCKHCVMHVKKAIEGLQGVSASEVEIGTAVVRYDDAKVGREEMKKAVEDAGYKVTV